VEQACTLLGGHGDFASHIPAQQVSFLKERNLQATEYMLWFINAKYQWLGLEKDVRIQNTVQKAKNGRDNL